eukprot:6930293-Prymnesium_polylepis.3
MLSRCRSGWFTASKEPEVRVRDQSSAGAHPNRIIRPPVELMPSFGSIVRVCKPAAAMRRRSAARAPEVVDVGG